MFLPAIDLTLIGGPTVLIEAAGVRLLTDPTFDGPGDHPGKTGVVLHKTRGPALTAEAVGPVDAVLLSHDQHADNLDVSGRAYAMTAKIVLTTPVGASRLGGPAVGLAPWASRTIATAAGRFTITATPARHGPPGAEAILGDVAGFVVSGEDGSDLVYVTGDTVFYEGVAEVAQRFHPKVVVAFAGAARTRGAFNLTMGGNDLLELAKAFPHARIVAVHNDGWAHFVEGPAAVESAAKTFSLSARLTTLEPGRATRVWSAAPVPAAIAPAE